ncbi:MAG: nucleotidyltransferase domain-containing protein [Bacteroidia bacterium]|nr:nucleotidyltransferase domain-containing protein [Bacteroidia bacterium]
MIGSLQVSLTKAQCEIIRAVLYFDIFKYPLTKNELFENSAVFISREQFFEELDALVSLGVLKQEGDFILNLERTEADILRRLRGNEEARKIMPVAHKFSKRIARFPFVESICLSGGLSKNYYDEKGDIDFFIVTKPGRLWICRTFLIIVYKLLPKHLKKYWCTNYFISSDNLAIPDKNVFTGTELAYLIPTVNYPIYKKIMENNNWYKVRFPNKAIASPENSIELPRPFFKKSVEWLLSGSFGNRIDNVLLRLTLKIWRKKYPHMNNEDFELQFRSRKDVCKRHTLGFQNKVLILWESKTIQFEKSFNIKIS